MTPMQLDNLIRAIREDDVQAFGSLLEQRQNVRFGRFDVLGVCYLYHSRRLIKTYGNAMMQGATMELDEPVSLYRDFAAVAGKALRLFAGAGKARVHPAYMLAVTGQWRLLRVTYPGWRLTPDQQAVLLDCVRLRYGVQGTIRDGRLLLPPLPLRIDRKPWLITAVVAAVVLLSVAVATLALSIPASAQLLLRAGSTHLTLRHDVTMTGHVTDSAQIIDGGGHTITVPIGTTPYMDAFHGAFRHCTLRLQGDDVTVDRAYAVLCLDNYGVFEDVTVVLDTPQETWTITLDNFEKHGDESGNLLADDCGFALLCVNNYGTIADVTMTGIWRWVGDGNVDAQAGSVAAYNHGIIRNVSLTCRVTAKTADVGGVVFSNEADGVIQGCALDAESAVQQDTDVYQWTPLVGGVAARNFGLIEDCSAACTVQSTKSLVQFPVGQDLTAKETLCGGIAALNHATVRHCIVTGTVVAGCGTQGTQIEYEGTVAIVGGIVADQEAAASSDTSPVLEQCISLGTVYGNGYRNFVGGLCGMAEGSLTANCFGGKLSTRGYLGTMCGRLVAPQSAWGDTIADNRIVAQWIDMIFSVQAIPLVWQYLTDANGETAVTVTEQAGVTTHTDEELRQQKEFWYEE